jgi:hypothetical protein
MGFWGDAWDWTKDAFADAADSDFSWVDVAVPFYGATHAAMKGIKAGGNAIGAQIGGSDDNFKPYAAANPTGYRYGGDPSNPNSIVGDATRGAFGTGAAAANLGRDATGFGQNAAAQGSQLLGERTADAQRFDAREVQQGDWWQQDATLGTLGGLEATEGPSAAQAQLQQGTNQALSSQLALARSGRGFGGNAAAMGLAQSNAAGIQANQANAAAALRAQENAAWRGRQGQNLTNIAGMQGQQSQADLGAAVQGRGQNDAMYGGLLGMGQNAWQTGVGAGLQGYGLGMQGYGTSIDAQRLATDIRGQEMSGNLAYEDAKMRAWAAENGYELQQQQISDQKDAATLAAVSSMGAAAIKGGGDDGGGGGGGGDGGGATRSDIRSKTNIVKTDAPAVEFARGTSSKRPFAFTPQQPDTAALDAVAAAPGYGYQYTDPSAPGAAPGDHYGPMAQDLASTPAGASVVKKMPDGKLGIDAPRLTLLNTSAVSAQQREIDELRERIAAFGSSPSRAVYPQPQQPEPSRGYTF